MSLAECDSPVYARIRAFLHFIEAKDKSNNVYTGPYSPARIATIYLRVVPTWFHSHAYLVGQASIQNFGLFIVKIFRSQQSREKSH